MTITTTLNRIRKHGPCNDGWEKLLKGLGKTKADDEPLPYSKIIEINGIDDALWCCRAEPEHSKTWRLFAVWCVRQVQHLLPNDRAIAAIDVAERYANGLATDDELATAWEADSAACWVAHEDAAWGAALWSTEVALERVDAGAADRVAALAAAEAAQKAKFLEMVG